MQYHEHEVSRQLARERHEELARAARHHRIARKRRARRRQVREASVFSRWVWRWRVRRSPAHWA
jgi:hypothetical protein